MKSKVALALVALTAITGCTVDLTMEGKGVRLISDMQKEKCNSIGTVTGYSELGLLPEDNTENAMNRVRNKTAQLGGNAFQVIDVSTLESSSTVIGEAFLCEN